MKAAILAVGSELLGTDRLDTNSLRLTALLERYGVELRRKAVIGDSEEEIAAELRALLPRVDLILVTGGLGPTADDVTREAVAAALGRQLHLDAEVLAALERRFQSFGWRMPEVNRRQAWVVDGAEVLANDRGTAPGLRVESGGCHPLPLPGRPHRAGGADGLRPGALARRALRRRRPRDGGAQDRRPPRVGGGGADRAGLRGVRPRGDHHPGQRRRDPAAGHGGRPRARAPGAAPGHGGAPRRARRRRRLHHPRGGHAWRAWSATCCAPPGPP